MILKVVDVKNPILRAKAKNVSKIDKKILALIADMQDTLKAQKDPEGVGLAAPQVNKSFQLFVVDYKNLKRTIINPEILETFTKEVEEKKPKKKVKKNEILEGCLSLPHYYGPIKRADRVKLKYMDETGKVIEEEFEGFAAQIMLHEIDHLNGVLFVDRILEQKSPLYKFDGDEWEEVEIL
ncbi:MAG TPA: peptide deformylase [Patescibacteria group bacterium]|nr:peptide deformylase [Patescibacteria group bacterium]